MQVDKYHMRNGDMTICKLMVAGVPGYMIYNARKFVRLFESAREAIEYAEQIRSSAKINGSGSA